MRVKEPTLSGPVPEYGKGLCPYCEHRIAYVELIKEDDGHNHCNHCRGERSRAPLMSINDKPINMKVGDYFNGKCLKCNSGSVYLIKASANTYWGQCTNRTCGHRVPLGDGPEYQVTRGPS